MKREFCLTIAVLAGSVAASPQNVLTVPAVKMGLWQRTSTTTMTGVQIPAEAAAKMKAMGVPVPGAAPRTDITQFCMTREGWQKSFADMQQKKSCELSNMHQDSSEMSADIVCKLSDGGGKGHMDIKFDSQEKMSEKLHMESTTSRQSQPIVMDRTAHSAYQGSDCKGISPGESKTIQ